MIARKARKISRFVGPFYLSENFKPLPTGVLKTFYVANKCTLVNEVLEWEDNK